MYQENFNHSLRHQLILVRFEKPKDYAVTLVKVNCPHQRIGLSKFVCYVSINKLFFSVYQRNNRAKITHLL